ncbi:hypothetical protein BJ684DRAFT_22668 [Piptocephalis cylindrospora]|uniref:Galactose oxidase n=1 Tax=Piptocephalis cylindrospora TaxID=1907219 RepID=A0A4P9Y4M6_9FUNG|nr:hypothetical protein BJ684DRAFT_22668 [Piptocephalis cylindrospora]|eukprot:RKP13928.1 hypothetical protein BJ684DRAFT_22668 [Piptocephalis cylindrospora]
MFWSRATTYGTRPPKALRAHTINLVGETFFVFGGCDARTCFNELYLFDADTLYWSNPPTYGDIPAPRRAHSATLLDNHIYVFGGGDGPNYFNDLHILDTETLVWTRAHQVGQVPGPRRAHTTCLYNRSIYLFGGGDGARALNAVYRLDTSDLSALAWTKMDVEGTPPHLPKLIVYGGSDGHECFSDCHILDLNTRVWSNVALDQVIPRLSHTAILVGSYLFIIGGHDGTQYSSEVLLLNLVTMTWETRKVYGRTPSGRGYHSVLLYDSRIFLHGGYDGQTVFDEMWILELSASAYLPQITGFEVHPPIM